MVYGSEKSLSKRGRIIATVVFWLLVGIPVLAVMWVWSFWLALVVLPFGVWATWDYLKRGDMFSQVDHSVSHHVRTGEDSKSRFGKPN